MLKASKLRKEITSIVLENERAMLTHVICSNDKKPFAPKLNFVSASLTIRTFSNLIPKFPSS
jgi:hypothetical protein